MGRMLGLRLLQLPAASPAASAPRPRTRPWPRPCTVQLLRLRPLFRLPVLLRRFLQLLVRLRLPCLLRPAGEGRAGLGRHEKRHQHFPV